MGVNPADPGVVAPRISSFKRGSKEEEEEEEERTAEAVMGPDREEEEEERGKWVEMDLGLIFLLALIPPFGPNPRAERFP